MPRPPEPFLGGGSFPTNHYSASTFPAWLPSQILLASTCPTKETFARLCTRLLGCEDPLFLHTLLQCMYRPRRIEPATSSKKKGLFSLRLVVLAGSLTLTRPRETSTAWIEATSLTPLTFWVPGLVAVPRYSHYVRRHPKDSLREGPRFFRKQVLFYKPASRGVGRSNF